MEDNQRITETENQGMDLENSELLAEIRDMAEEINQSLTEPQ